MKIAAYKVTGTATKDPQGIVHIKIMEDTKKFNSIVEELSTGNTHSIVTKSTEVSNHNSKQLDMAKMTLNEKEDTSEVFLTLWYVEG